MCRIPVRLFEDGKDFGALVLVEGFAEGNLDGLPCVRRHCVEHVKQDRVEDCEGHDLERNAHFLLRCTDRWIFGRLDPLHHIDDVYVIEVVRFVPVEDLDLCISLVSLAEFS